jgi:hypothetical protein
VIDRYYRAPIQLLSKDQTMINAYFHLSPTRHASDIHPVQKVPVVHWRIYSESIVIDVVNSPATVSASTTHWFLNTLLFLIEFLVLLLLPSWCLRYFWILM